MIDWTDCALVQRDPRYVSGQPALSSQPRLLVEPLIESAELGMDPEEIAKVYRVPVETVRALVTYAQAHRVASTV